MQEDTIRLKVPIVIIHSQEWSCLWRRCYNNSTWNRCKSHKVIWVIEIYSWGMEDRGLGLSITFTTWSDRINYCVVPLRKESENTTYLIWCKVITTQRFSTSNSRVIRNVENGYHIQLKRVVLLLVRAQPWLLIFKN